MASISKDAPSSAAKDVISTNWDIDKYKPDYETEEHWGLKKKFMESIKDKFPEQRVVCLAQVFFNMEFMGCSYPPETMRLVAELSKDVAKDFRQSRESRLKRTFVGASAAAEQRAKGIRNAQQQQRERQSDGSNTSGGNSARSSNSNQRAHFQLNQGSDGPGTSGYSSNRTFPNQRPHFQMSNQGSDGPGGSRYDSNWSYSGQKAQFQMSNQGSDRPGTNRYDSNWSHLNNQMAQFQMNQGTANRPGQSRYDSNWSHPNNQRPHFQMSNQNSDGPGTNRYCNPNPYQRGNFQTNQSSDFGPNTNRYDSSNSKPNQRAQFQTNQSSDIRSGTSKNIVNSSNPKIKANFQMNQIPNEANSSKNNATGYNPKIKANFQMNQIPGGQNLNFNNGNNNNNSNYRQKEYMQSKVSSDKNGNSGMQSGGGGEYGSMKRRLAEDVFGRLKYGKFVLNLIGGRNCISLSAQRCKVPYEERPTDAKKVEIYLNNEKIAESDEPNVKASKAEAFQKAMKNLQTHCYSIKPNPQQDTIKIDKKNKQIVCDIVREPVDVDGGKLDDKNKGFKMMKMMGWSGGGLGANMQGREDPISYLIKNNRYGLGNSNDLDKKYFREMLRNYIKSDDIRQLQFEPTFTKDERAALHEIAASLNLKSVARGNGENRYLTINKKNISEEKILMEVLINKNPRYCNKYLVQVPESKRQLFPDHVQHLNLE